MEHVSAAQRWISKRLYATTRATIARIGGGGVAGNYAYTAYPTMIDGVVSTSGFGPISPISDYFCIFY